MRARAASTSARTMRAEAASWTRTAIWEAACRSRSASARAVAGAESCCSCSLRNRRCSCRSARRVAKSSIDRVVLRSWMIWWFTDSPLGQGGRGRADGRSSGVALAGHAERRVGRDFQALDRDGFAAVAADAVAAVLDAEEGGLDLGEDSPEGVFVRGRHLFLSVLSGLPDGPQLGQA